VSQRNSGYERKPDEGYETIVWPVLALLSHVTKIKRGWDPCDRGKGKLVATLRNRGIDAIGTTENFLTVTAPPKGVTHLITNPPYGENRRGEEAVRFIEHALELRVPQVAMLLRNDFDSAITRPHLFRHCSTFAGKVVLLGRIKWSEGPSSPSDNHSWFLWDRKHAGPPLIRYATRSEAEAANQALIGSDPEWRA
jgi:hypothetical protein